MATHTGAAHQENVGDTFFYFAYGTYMDTNVFSTAVMSSAFFASPPSSSSAAVPFAPRRVAVAYITGHRLALDAVSVESPRLGVLNVQPNAALRVVEDDSALLRQPDPPTPLHAAGEEGRVYGVVYELPQELRSAVLEAAGQEGSYNCYANLRCHVVVAGCEEAGSEKDLCAASDTTHPPTGVSTTLTAIVVAALDAATFERKYDVAALEEVWMPLPALLSPPPLRHELASVDHTATKKGEAAKGSRADGRVGGSGRWPGLHWCNCISSDRVAPSPQYLQKLHDAFHTHHALVEGVPADYRAAYGAVYGLPGPHDVAVRARDIAHDPNEQTTWYLAYGSNMSWEQVCVRIGPPYSRRPVRLDGYVLVANKLPLSSQYASFGYYNIEPVEERARKTSERRQAGETVRDGAMPSYVCGAGYRISLAQLALMDAYEMGYDRVALVCEDIGDLLAAESTPPSVSNEEPRRGGGGGVREAPSPSSSPSSRPRYECWAYIARETSETLLPSREYLSRVLEGSDVLPAAYSEAIRATETNPQRSPRQQLRLRKML